MYFFSVSTKIAYIAEQQLLRDLSVLRKALNNRARAIETVLSFETGDVKSKDPSEYMGHPIHALKVVNRTFQTK